MTGIRSRRIGAGMALALSLAMPGLAHAACQIAAIELPVTMSGMRPITTVGINGTPVRLLVDSGAFYSMLSDSAAAQLKLEMSHLPWGFEVRGITGEIEARRTTVKALQLAGGTLPDIEFLVGGNDMGHGAMGLLGRNILGITDVEYDLAHGVIRLMLPKGDDCKDKDMAYWAGKDTPVAMSELRRDPSRTPQSIRTSATVNGKQINVHLDTGALSVLTLSAAKRAGVAEADMKFAGMTGGAGRGRAKEWTAPVQKFEIGGEAISNIRVGVGDFSLEDDDMLLGIDFFLSHRIYVSKLQRKMYFTYNGGPVFANSAVAMAAAAAQAGDSASAPVALPALPPGAEQPTDAAGFARRGVASSARLNHAAALADLDRACELAPGVAEYFVQRALVHVEMKHMSQALQDFDTALHLDPAQPDALMHRAAYRASRAAKAGADDREAALQDLQALDKAIAPQADMRRTMAAIYNSLEEHDKAIRQWDLWASSRPNDMKLGGVLNGSCWARMLRNTELDKALDDCNRAVKQDSKDAAFLDSRAWVRLRRAEWRDALGDFNRALKIRPDAAWSLYGRGLVRIRQGEVNEGRADIEAARKLEPKIDAETGKYGLALEALATPAAAPQGQ